MMLTDLTPILSEGGSPFDAIRRVDAQGEHWVARDLRPVLGYDKWERFEATVERVERAIIAIDNAASKTGESAAQHVSRRQEAVANGVPGTTRADYRLTRYGAYMTAMNGDPRKEAIAEAQMYFAVRTRQAEIAEQDTNSSAIPKSFADALQLAADQAREIERQAAQIESDAPKVAYVDNFLRNNDACLLRQLAKRIGFKERDLRDELMARRIIFRTPIARFSESKQRNVVEYRYEPATAYMAWFRECDQPNAPRHHNNQMRTTLYVTPAGKVGIARLLGRLDSTPLPLEGASS